MNDPILYWNEVALEANKASHTTGMDKENVNGPTLSSRALAIVHIAMYDAYIATTNSTLLPYFATPKDVAASETAAIAAAAHACLTSLYPSQRAFFQKKHTEAVITGSILNVNKGHTIGQKIANLILFDRKDDPKASDDGYASYPTHGTHRPDPWDSSQGYHAPFYGRRAKLFSSMTRYALNKPPKASSTDPDYAKAVKEMRGLGIIPELMGTVPDTYEKRNTEQTMKGIFWGYDGAKGLGTPPRLYNQIIREMAMKNNNSVEENVQLFTLINVAMGDAGIMAWEQKYRYNYWRPVVGMREHDGSMGPLGISSNAIDPDCDPLWLPLGAPNSNNPNKNNSTPHFPAYPSGHATFGAAVFRIAELFFKSKSVDLAVLFNKCNFVSDEFDGETTDNKGIVRPRHNRKFSNFDEMIVENGLSRVYLGVHWFFDSFAVDTAGNPDFMNNVGGVPLGINIAKDIFNGGSTAVTQNAGIKKSTIAGAMP